MSLRLYALALLLALVAALASRPAPAPRPRVLTGEVEDIYRRDERLFVLVGGVEYPIDTNYDGCWRR